MYIELNPYVSLLELTLKRQLYKLSIVSIAGSMLYVCSTMGETRLQLLKKKTKLVKILTKTIKVLIEFIKMSIN